MDCKLATGPCWARYRAQQLWRGEEFYLSIDSHTRFIQDWDKLLLEQLAACPSQKAILTTYPVGYERGKPTPTYALESIFNLIVYLFRLVQPWPVGIQGPEVNFYCRFFFWPRRHVAPLRQTSRSDPQVRISWFYILRCISSFMYTDHNVRNPIPSSFWVSGYSFSSSAILKEVPYDPHLQYIFFGEESSMTVRLWTHGWDFFAPGSNFIWHLWSRSYRPVFRYEI